jgi:hypothetical protein
VVDLATIHLTVRSDSSRLRRGGRRVKTKRRPGGSPVDLRDRRFGRLIARRPTAERQRGSVVWLCDCDCGTRRYRAEARRLTSGGVKSCGCLQQSRRLDLRGQKFGRLTVRRRTAERRDRSVVWLCDCDCGTRGVRVATRRLTVGAVTSCGCGRGGPPPVDLRGRRFGRLTARELTAERRFGSPLWLCDCACGTQNFRATAASLSNGRVRSCGCRRSRRRPAAARQ